jgi:hypothetical protein
VGRISCEEKPAEYRIVVEGKLDGRWSEWLGDMAVAWATGSGGTRVTTLTGTVTDQSALRGILSRIWDLNLTVISVDRIDDRIGTLRKRRRRKEK